MTDHLSEFDPADAGVLPELDQIFSSERVVIDPVDADPPPGKLAGGGDSVRNVHSARKAPGGKDASRQKDGG